MVKVSIDVIMSQIKCVILILANSCLSVLIGRFNG